MSSSLDLLDLRLRYIEDRVVGSRPVTTSEINSSSISDQLIQIESKLKELTAGKERFNNCYRSCKELDKYLDPEYVDRLMSSDSTKFETILSFEEQIKSQTKDWEKVEELSKTIDSNALRNFDKLYPKLNQIRLNSLEQSRKSAKVEEKTRQLILTYNQWLENIKTQLKEWDQMLTQKENEKKQNKK